MVQPAILNSEAHKNVKIKLGRGAEFGEAVHMVPVTARELQSLAVEYPIFFIKNSETEQYELNVMLGFEAGENLLLDGDQWDAQYLPLHVLRQPFMIARQKKSPESEETEVVISLDMDSPRVNETDGVALFNEDGSPAPVIEDIDRILSDLMKGNEQTKLFIDTLTELDLIEAANLDINFSQEDQRRYQGCFTVSAEKLRALKGEQLENFHSRGYLEACHIMMASVRNMNKLIAKKNARTAAAAA